MVLPGLIRSNRIFFISDLRAILKLKPVMTSLWALIWQLHVNRRLLYLYTWWSANHYTDHAISVLVPHRAFDFDRLDKSNKQKMHKKKITYRRKAAILKLSLCRLTMAWWDGSSPYPSRLSKLVWPGGGLESIQKEGVGHTRRTSVIMVRNDGPW